MELRKGRPEITAADHPATIYRALMASSALWAAEQSQEAYFAWSKKEQDATGTLGDAFGIYDPDKGATRPDGSDTTLYMGLDELEYALVGYGCELIDKNETANTIEIDNVNAVLHAIDKIRPKHK